MKHTSHKRKEGVTGEVDKPVTLGVLLQCIDEFLLPRMEEMQKETIEEITQKMTDKMSGLEYRLKEYVDKRTGDILDRLDGKEKRHKTFHTGVISALQNHTEVTKKEILSLRESA